MATPNNLTTQSQDKTTSWFNNFYDPKFDVSQGVDDTAIGFFEQVTANKETARSLAGAVIYTAKSQGLDPMTVINQFAALPKGQLNSYLVLFLNQNRVGTSYLGVSNQPVTNKYIARTILP